MNETIDALKLIGKIEFVEIKDNKITIIIQNGPIKECGINGTQINTLGDIWVSLLYSFNKKFPCRENSITITKIEEALMWQEKRTKDREARKVEGLNHA